MEGPKLSRSGDATEPARAGNSEDRGLSMRSLGGAAALATLAGVVVSQYGFPADPIREESAGLRGMQLEGSDMPTELVLPRADLAIDSLNWFVEPTHPVVWSTDIRYFSVDYAESLPFSAQWVTYQRGEHDEVVYRTSTNPGDWSQLILEITDSEGSMRRFAPSQIERREVGQGEQSTTFVVPLGIEAETIGIRIGS